MAAVKNACLIVIDGWGVSDNIEGNAILNSETPVMTRLAKEHQYTEILASGLSVGLPDGLMGNSEVGHMNIGAGRVVYQDIVRIELAIAKHTLKNNKELLHAFETVKSGTGRMHFLGLMSDGGVHSHMNHLFALLAIAKEAGIPHSYVHAITDGRDTDPKSSVKFLQTLLDKVNELNYGTVASVVGRYYAMDRDNRHERTKLAYEAYTQGLGEQIDAAHLIEGVQERYNKGENDEFLKPFIVNSAGLIQDGDVVLTFNFRSDRMRQITEAFGIKRHFETAVQPKVHLYTMTRYKHDFPFPVLFPPQSLDNVLAEWLAKHGVHQYHAAETEKYAHVTFFFNGGREIQFENEVREVIPSPKVATYDLQPAMSVKGVADAMVKAISSGKYPFVMCNFAPPDMVGHTGKYSETVEAVKVTDAAVGQVLAACQEHNYTLFITADHGNAEQMLNEAGGPHTAHTVNPVPFIMSNNGFKFERKEGQALCDVAPTILQVMGLPKPEEMDGSSLVV